MHESNEIEVTQQMIDAVKAHERRKIEKTVKARSHESWEERFPRYAHNAKVTAQHAERDAAQQRWSAKMHGNAAANALGHGDREAADLYDEMSEAALEAADALDDIAMLARKVAEHYERKEQQ